MTPIGFIDANDQIVEADLGDSTFYLGLSWNEEGQFWTLSLRDLDSLVLISGIKVVANYPLLYQVRQPGFPAGELVVDAVAGTALDRTCFTEGRATLYFVTAADFTDASV